VRHSREVALAVRLGRSALWTAGLSITLLFCACSKPPTDPLPSSSAGPPSTPTAAPTTNPNAPAHAREQAPVGSPSPDTTASSSTAPSSGEEGGSIEEFGAEAQVGVDGFQQLPETIRRIVAHDRCAYIGKPIPLENGSRLWVGAPTALSCMGSGGGSMLLVLDTQGKPPTTVLQAGTVAGINLDRAKTHHGLPDAFVQYATNCCGSNQTGYRFDGTKYEEATSRLAGTPAQLIADSATGLSIPGVDLKKGCSLNVGSVGPDGDRMGLKLADLECNDTDRVIVWLINQAGGDKEASVKVLAREELMPPRSDSDPQDTLVIATEKGSSAVEIIFPHVEGGSITWHLDGDRLTRIPPLVLPPS
jgi:hypothetical protein